MVYTGRIYEIVHTGPNSAKIVLKKKDKGKLIDVAIDVYGYWKDKSVDELNLQPKDKIRGNIYLKSKKYNGKHYTDVFFREIFLIERAPVKMKKTAELFDIPQNVDIETGEINE